MSLKGHGRVQRLCGADSEAFWPADCTLGNFLLCLIPLDFMPFFSFRCI